MNGGALAYCAFNCDEAPRLLNGAIDGREAKPRAFTLFLGCEEGLHGAFAYFWGHPLSRVADGQPDEVTGPRVGNACRSMGIKRDVAGFDREHAALGHSVPRVDCQIEDCIIDIADIGQSRAQIRRALQSDGYLIAERSPQ